MAGTSAAGMLAGCGGDASDVTDTTVRTETTIPWQVDGCDTGLVEPSESSGQFTLLHGRQAGGTRLLQGTRTLFNQNDNFPTMNLQKGPSDGYLNQLRTSIPAGEGPHAFQWAHDIAGEFVQSEFLSDQSGNLRAEECMFTDAAWQATEYDGQRIGLPFAAECPALIYNKDVLDEIGAEPPESFSDWTDIMEQYNDPDNGQYGLSHPLNAYFSSWATQAYGADIYNGQEDELGITSDEAIQGLNIILEDLKPYMPSDPSEQAQMSVFESGDSPFLVNGPWAIAGLLDQDLNIGTTRIPAPDGAESRPYSGIQMYFYSKKMNNGGNSARAAREFTEWYCTNIERILNLINNSSYIPAIAGLDRSLLPETVRGYAEQFETGYLMPQNPKMNAVWSPYETNMLDAFNSGNDPGPLMESAAEEIRNSWNN